MPEQLLHTLRFPAADIVLALPNSTWASNHRHAEFVENQAARAII
jgi:hypothetical protein